MIKSASLPGILTVLIALAPVALAAQDSVTARPIAVGAAVTDSLPAGATHAFTVSLDGGQFVYGSVDQRSIDTRITVRDPDGAVVRRFNGTRRGAEDFHFDATAAGEYRIELDMPADSAGTYTARLLRVEPIATDPAARIDQIMLPYSGDVPGAVIGVVRDGRLIFARGYGKANLAYDLPFTTGTRSNIGSTAKQFTAFAILLLHQQGVLSVDDDVRRYIPELPDLGHIVTLRHLMTHTSGYREILNTLALGGRLLLEGDYIDRDEMIQVVQRQPELQNEPGAEWNYNNTAFALLSMVVERTTGTPFGEWMRDNVFLPIGMRHTLVRARPTQIVTNRAHGYLMSPDGEFQEAEDLAAAMGAGGIYTTIGDLARWIENLETGRHGGKDIVEAMTTPYVLTSGDTTEYGLGLMIDEFRGLRRIHHGGADIAHRSTFMIFPGTRTGFMVLSNNGSFPGAVANVVVETFLGDALEPAVAAVEPATDVVSGPFDPTTWDPASFDAMSGSYALDQMPAFVITFVREGDTIFGQPTGQPRLRLEPTSDTTFTLVGAPASVTFRRGDDGSFTHLILHQNGDHRASRMAGETWSPTAGDLAAYTGRYYSEELETYYTLALNDDDKLVIRHRRFDDVVLAPAAEADSFTGGFPVADVRFERDDTGRVTGLLAGNVRARGIRFVRVP